MFIILVLLEFTTRKLIHNLWTMRYKFSAWKLPHTMILSCYTHSSSPELVAYKVLYFHDSFTATYFVKNLLEKHSCFLRHLTRQHVYDNLSWWNTLKILDPELLVFMILKLMMLIENTKKLYYLGHDWNSLPI